MGRDPDFTVRIVDANGDPDQTVAVIDGIDDLVPVEGDSLVFEDGAWRVAPTLPWTIDIDPFAGAASNVNWPSTFVAGGSVAYGGGALSSGAQNDAIAWDVVLGKGQWVFALAHIRSPSIGIYTVQLDGVAIGTIDGYDAGGGVLISNFAFSVAATVRARLTLKMATKNASSSGFNGFIQHIQLRRTA